MTAFPKSTRTVDEKLLAQVRKLPCIACSDSSPDAARAAIAENEATISHPHHLVSRKAGGNDVAENLMPLCPNHHRLVHQRSLRFMSLEYSLVYAWLLEAGWEFRDHSWASPVGVRA